MRASDAIFSRCDEHCRLKPETNYSKIIKIFCHFIAINFGHEFHSAFLIGECKTTQTFAVAENVPVSSENDNADVLVTEFVLKIQKQFGVVDARQVDGSAWLRIFGVDGE